ncbi:SusC/RagA family TonB-linked outer membrane protein [Parapedobacter sp. DT-150]|uniref:SusC/RagA family TonB-linked outer membrane protein n=1 Tax=Parapedobacter sp. DT-150 TaxID=3396162 RepID=UPI003F1D3EA2
MKQKLLCFLLGLLLIGSAYAQERSIRGRVTASADGSPLSGTLVTVQGTSRVTQTDDNGDFVISASNADYLVFHAVGFTDRTVQVGTSQTLNLVLEVFQEELDEVVVVAYGTVRRSDFTGSALTVDAKSLDKRPLSNPLVALQGAGPGVQTTAPSGVPGSSPGITIRGVGTLNAGSSALYVVDGVEYGEDGWSNINPDDVASITVLKDAATIAMYGSRGANGVVMVTTKKGSTGKTSLDFKAQFGANTNGVPAYNTVNAGEYYELMWEAYRNSLHFGEANVPLDIASQISSGTLPRNADGTMTYDGEDYDDIVQFLGNYNAYNVPNDQLIGPDGRLNPNAQLLYPDDLSWIDQAARTGKRNEYTMSYSSGFGKTDIYGSLNYLDETGWGLRSEFDRFAARLNVNSQLTTYLKTGLNLNANQNRSNSPATGGGIVNPFSFSRGIGPIYPVHVHDPVTGEYVLDEFGDRRYDIGNLAGEFGLTRPYNGGRHAIAENLWNIDRSTRDYIGARTYIDLNILPWLTLTSNLTADIYNVRDEGYENTIVGDGAPAGRYNQEWEKSRRITFNQLANINKTFNGDHNVNATLGHESVKFIEDGISGMRQGQGFEGFLTFSNFIDINSLSSDLDEYRIEGYFGRVNYDYKGRYYLSGMIRRDGLSKLPPANRWANFWSVGGAWRIENEPFFDVEWVNLLKLRASYGVLGNTDLGNNYPFQGGYEFRNNAGAAGTAISMLASPDLKWERQIPLDIGIDFSLFKGRLSGTAEFYDRKSDELLLSLNLPYHYGGETDGNFEIDQNVGSMYNRGFEFSLTGNLIRRSDFNWNMTFNISTVSNKILEMPEEMLTYITGNYQWKAGKSRYDYYTRKFYGVDPENGQVMYLGVTEYNPDNADMKLIDHGDGRVDTVTYNHSAARLDYIGKSALPKAYGSLVNSFTYKDFDFGFVLMYSVGGWVVDGQYGGFMSPGPSNGANLHRDLLNGWRQPGDQTDIPRMDLNRTSQYGAASDRFLTRSDYLSLSSINASYRLPASIASRIRIKGARLFVSAENLWFVSARKGMNPMSDLTSAAGSGTYNFMKTVNVGINLSL